MAATLGCNTARVLYNAPVAGTRTPEDAPTSSISRLHLRGRRANGGNKRLSLRLAGRQGVNRGVSLVRALLNNEGDKVRELASEKAVESGPQVVQDTKNLANGQSPVELDAKAEDAADTASYEGDVREKVVDVASDMAVDNTADVDALAEKDAGPLAEAYGRNDKDTAEALESKAAEVSDREVRKDPSASGSFFKDQVVETEGKKLEEGKQQVGSQFQGLTRTISKNLKEGIDASRPSLEELSRSASKGVKAGRENLDYAAEGAAEISGDAREVLDGANRALDKRLKVINLAAEDARQTGNMVAELAAKGWNALTKSTERFVGNFQKNVGDLQATAQEKAQEAKLNAEKTAEQAQSKFAEAKSTVQAKTDELKNTAQQKASESRSELEDTAGKAQSKFDEAKGNVQAKTGELKDTAQEKVDDVKDNIESKGGAEKDSFSNAVETMKDFEQNKGNDQFPQSGGSAIGQTPGTLGHGQLTGLANENGISEGPSSSAVGQTPGTSVPFADSGKANDEWQGKSQ